MNKCLMVISSLTALFHSSTAVLAHNKVDVFEDSEFNKSCPRLKASGLEDSFISIDENTENYTKSMLMIEESFLPLDETVGTHFAESMIGSDEKTAVRLAKPLAPVVKSNAGKFVLDKNFVGNVDTYAGMSELSYHLAKGRVEQSNVQLEKYAKAGWKINGFSGISGIKKTNEDLAGFVAFNPKTSEAVVCFHGSQDGNDWENNLDSQMVQTREMGYNFHGKVHRGFATRYNSSKKDIEGLLTRIFEGLDDEGKDKFHVTVTGHSLGGGETSVAYADLSTSLMKEFFGGDYRNAESNRVRAMKFSPPRAFNEAAVKELGDVAGVHNIVIDTNNMDLVSMFGPGKTTKEWLENSSPYGLTRAVLSVGKALGLTKVSNPQAFAQEHAGAQHLGYKAYQDVNETYKKANSLPVDPKVAEESSKKGFIGRLKNKIKGYFAPYHYGTEQAHGASFDPRLIVPGTLEERINKVHAPKVEAPKKPWYQFWK